MIRRLFFFFITNIAIMVMISLTLNLLGVKPYLSANGIDYSALMVFCLVWGMGSSIISLFLSKTIAKWSTGTKIVNPATPGEYGWLVEMIHGTARKARMKTMPEVGVYPGAEPNAFATGYSERSCLVSVSEGLLRAMSRDEIEGVIGHEIAHIKNGDMVTLTLIQGVVNAFGMFLARAIAWAVAQATDEEKQAMVNLVLHIVLDIVFTLIGTIIVASFSRKREFRADADSARILGRKDKMISALRALQRMHGIESEYDHPQEAVAALKISNNRSKGRLFALFATHPPLEDRISALERA
jgi:heat shock protein HtpX